MKSDLYLSRISIVKCNVMWNQVDKYCMYTRELKLQFSHLDYYYY